MTVLTLARRQVGDDQAVKLLAEGARLGAHDAVSAAIEFAAALADRPAPAAEPRQSTAVRPQRRCRAARTAPGAPALTARERQIAELIARGLSNRAIAAELVISPATAARHVANIFSKLGVTSRAQVAAWTAERPRD